MINKKLSFALFALTLGASVCTLGGTAAAASKNGCTVTSVFYDSGRVAMTCANDGNNYYGFTSAPGCAMQSLDTLKIWLSMLQSALLSGHTVDLAFQATSSACGVPSLQAVTMR